MTTRQHNVVAAILLIVGGFMIRISAVDLQPYPELALQSPLVKGMQLMAADVGNHSLSLRWFALVSSGIGMWLIFLIGKRFLTYKGAVQAMVLAGVSLPWVTYGRQANADIVGVVLMVGSLYTLLNLVETASKQNLMLFSVGYIALCGLAGVTSGAAVLAVAATGLVVAATARRWSILFLVGAGLPAAQVWTVKMNTPPGPYGLPHEAGTLLISMPVAIAALMWLVGIAANKDLRPRFTETNIRAITSLFGIAVALVIVYPQRSILSLVWVAPFASLLTVFALERFRTQRTPTLLLTALVAMIVTSVAALIYYSVNFTAVMRLTSQAGGLAWFSYMLFSVVRGQKPTSQLQLVVRLFTPAYYGAIAVNCFIAASLIIFGSPFVIEGGRSIAHEASVLADDTDEPIAFVYHAHTSADAADAQMRYYLEASYRTIALPANGIVADVINGIVGSRLVIYFHPGSDRSFEPAIDALLSNNYMVHKKTRDYTLYLLRQL